MMPSSRDHILGLVRQPSESLTVELKSWFDPRESEGIAKIAKACIALRNHNGGYILVGFSDVERQPDPASAPSDIASRFHPDTVQAIISKYASEPFETHIHLVELEGTSFPVIEVEAGVRTPVAAKRELVGSNSERPLIKKDAVYVRSLQSNGTVSTTEATFGDWPRIIEICFENREADIGRFVRRHLSNLESGTIQALSNALNPPPPDPTTRDFARSLLDHGHARYLEALVRRGPTLPPFGTMEIAAVVSGQLPERVADSSFRQLLLANNPELTGWPIWLDSSAFHDDDARPYVFEDAWEAFIWAPRVNVASAHLDFWRLDPRGRFYLLRALQDDFSPAYVQPLATLDFGLAILRTAEAIAVALAFGKAMAAPETAEIAFAFRWGGLDNRKLVSWANVGRYISPGRRCWQNEVTSEITMPVDSAKSAIAAATYQIVSKLFAVFDGFAISKAVVEDLVTQLLERRL